jgi:hypothetical protein
MYLCVLHDCQNEHGAFFLTVGIGTSDIGTSGIGTSGIGTRCAVFCVTYKSDCKVQLVQWDESQANLTSDLSLRFVSLDNLVKKPSANFLTSRIMPCSCLVIMHSVLWCVKLAFRKYFLISRQLFCLETFTFMVLFLFCLSLTGQHLSRVVKRHVLWCNLM